MVWVRAAQRSRQMCAISCRNAPPTVVNRHGLVQVSHLAVALGIGQLRNVFGHIYPFGGHAVGDVRGEPHVRGGAGLPVGRCVAADLLVGVALGVDEA